MPKVMASGSHAGGRGRRRGGHAVASTLAEINVVPLVDVMLVQLGNETSRLDVLRERMRQMMEGRADKDKQVFIRSDGGVTMQQMIDVMDRLKEGGVLQVGVLSQPFAGR